MLESRDGQQSGERKVVPFRRPGQPSQPRFDLVAERLPYQPPEDPFFYIKQVVNETPPSTQEIWQRAYAEEYGEPTAPVVMYDALSDEPLPSWENVAPLARTKRPSPVVVRFTATTETEEYGEVERVIEIPLDILGRVMEMSLSDNPGAQDIESIKGLVTWYRQNHMGFQDKLLERWQRYLDTAKTRAIGPTEEPQTYWSKAQKDNQG